MFVSLIKVINLKNWFLLQFRGMCGVINSLLASWYSSYVVRDALIRFA